MDFYTIASRENYSYGTQFVAINLSYGLGTVFSAHFYLPVFFRLQEKSAYAYLERRFGRKARWVAGGSLIVTFHPTVQLTVFVCTG